MFSNQIVESAGTTASWDQLDITLPMHKDATLNILISSRGKAIGQCTVTRDKLLNGQRTEQNSFVVSFYLSTMTTHRIKSKILFLFLFSCSSSCSKILQWRTRLLEQGS